MDDCAELSEPEIVMDSPGVDLPAAISLQHRPQAVPMLIAASQRGA